ncbi:MAG: cytochrome P450, partial [Alphaproteobacteria bacterium]|nr:cytochrome P450 [Alphaproteobacteria bacterium]
FPFGGGPRLCLGHRFAMIESVIAIAMMAQRYEFTLIPGQKIEPQPMITLRPSQSIMFRLRHRKFEKGAVAHHRSDNAPTRSLNCPFEHEKKRVNA